MAFSLLPSLRTEAATTLEYQVFSEGSSIGSTTVTTRELAQDGVSVVAIEAHTALRVVDYGMTVFSLESEEVSLVGERGLLHHDSRIEIDGEQVVVRGWLEDRTFTLEVVAGRETGTRPIAAKDFDCTSIEGPDLTFETVGSTRRLRVLDLDQLEIVKRRFTWVRDENLIIGGQPVACRVIDVADRFGQSRRWIAKDAYDTLIQEEGADRDGPFRIILTHYPWSVR